MIRDPRNIDEWLHEKFRSFQADYSASDWQEAESYIRKRERYEKRSGSFLFFSGVAVALLVYLGTPLPSTDPLAAPGIAQTETSIPETSSFSDESPTVSQQKVTASLNPIKPKTTPAENTVAPETASSTAENPASATAAKRTVGKTRARTNTGNLLASGSTLKASSTAALFSSQAQSSTTNTEAFSQALKSRPVMEKPLHLALRDFEFPENEPMRYLHRTPQRPVLNTTSVLEVGLVAQVGRASQDLGSPTTQISDFRSQSLGIQGRFMWKPRWSVQTGFLITQHAYDIQQSYQTLHENVEERVEDNSYWNHFMVEVPELPRFVNGVPVGTPGTTLQEDSAFIQRFDTSYVNRTDTNQSSHAGSNWVRYIEIPVLVSYEVPMGAWSLEFTGGVHVGVLWQTRGLTIDANQYGTSRSLVTNPYRQFTTTWVAQPAVSYRFASDWKITAGPQLQWMPRGVFQSDELTSDLTRYGFQVGIWKTF